MREVGEVRRRGVLTVDVQPDEALGVDRAPEDLGHVQGIDVGEAGADDGQGGVEVGAAE